MSMNEKEEQIVRMKELMKGAPPKLQYAIIRIIGNNDFF